LGNSATKKVLQLHEAACFTRHLTVMGEEQFVQGIVTCLASSLTHHEASPPPPLEPTRGAIHAATSCDKALVEHDDSRSTTAAGKSGAHSSGRIEHTAAPVQLADQHPELREHCTSPGAREANSGELETKLRAFYVRFNPGHVPHAAKHVASNGGRGEPHFRQQPAPTWTEGGGPALACKYSSHMAATAQWQSAKVRRLRKPLRRCRLPTDDDAS